MRVGVGVKVDVKVEADVKVDVKADVGEEGAVDVGDFGRKGKTGVCGWVG